MLQRVVAVVLAVLGLVSIGLAVASATIWKPDEVVRAHTSTEDQATLLITEAGVLDLVDDSVTIEASRADGGPVALAIGREPDVLGWVGEDAHTLVTGLKSWQALSTSFVDGNTVAVEPDDEADAKDSKDDPADSVDAEADSGAGSGLVGPDPTGSDMWLASESGDGSASLTFEVPQGRYLLLVANTGDDAPAPDLTLVWEREVSSPWLIPGLIAGVVLLVVAALLLVLIRGGVQRPKSGTKAPAGVQVESGADTGPTGVTGRTGLGSSEQNAPGYAGPTSPIISRAESPDEPSRPMSRRELRELAEQEAAAERARTRRPGRLKRRRAGDESDLEIESGEQPGSSRSARSARSTRSTRSVRSARSGVSATTGSLPSVGSHDAFSETSHSSSSDSADAIEDRNRADAWRRAWGFQQSWEPGTEQDPDSEREDRT